MLGYMLAMKHNGAVENVQAGFVAVAARWASQHLRKVINCILQNERGIDCVAYMTLYD